MQFKSSDMTIEILDQNTVTERIQNQVAELFGQLNSEIDQLGVNQIFDANENTVLAICKIDDAIVGMASMATYKVISGHKGMIEDVVVDKDQRGKGIGRRLMEKLLEEGKKQNLDQMLLFSGHHRLPAINLYKSLGFKLKESGLYVLNF